MSVLPPKEGKLHIVPHWSAEMKYPVHSNGVGTIGFFPFEMQIILLKTMHPLSCPNCMKPGRDGCFQWQDNACKRQTNLMENQKSCETQQRGYIGWLDLRRFKKQKCPSYKKHNCCNLTATVSCINSNLWKFQTNPLKIKNRNVFPLNLVQANSKIS